MKTAGKKRGFTLIETVIVIVILGIIAGVSVFSLTRFYELWLVSTYKMDALWGSRYLMRELSFNIRQVKDKSSVVTANDTRFEFNMINSATGGTQRVAYEYTNNQLLKNGTAIMNEVTNFVFSYYDSNFNSINPTAGASTNIRSVGMEFTLTSAGEPVTERTVVKCRNLNN